MLPWITLAQAPVHERMETHWNLAGSLQVEVIRGNLEVVRRVAERLAALPPEAMPAELAGELAALRSEAATLAAATSLEEATRGVARVGGACAGCHARTGGGPPARLTAVPPPEDGMVQHQLAADWLWVGLVAPSPSGWDRGARELSEHGPDERVRGIATRAAGVHATDAQVALWSELAGACASCHVPARQAP